MTADYWAMELNLADQITKIDSIMRWPFAPRPEPPSLASGLTIAQWNELYGEPAIRRLFAKFRKVAFWTGCLAVGLWGLVLVLTEPGHKAGRLLSIVLLVWQLSATVFAVSGGMIVWKWLVDRYGDKPTYESTEGKSRGKYRIRRR